MNGEYNSKQLARLRALVGSDPAPANSSLCLYLTEMNGGRDRTRTCDLLRVKQAL